MLAILAAGGWAALVLLYAPVLSSGLRAPATAAIGLLVLLALAGVFLPALRPAIAVLAAAVALVAVAWARLAPSSAGDWPPEVGRLAHAVIEGDRVTIRNVRNFEWQGTDRFVERWETREDLNAHGRAPHMKEWRSYSTPLRVAPPVIEIISDGKVEKL